MLALLAVHNVATILSVRGWNDFRLDVPVFNQQI